MGLLGNSEEQERAPLADAMSDRDEAIRWARELIAQGLKVVRLRSSTGQAVKADAVGDQARSTGE